MLGRGAAVGAIAQGGLRIESAGDSRLVRLDAVEYRPGLGSFDTVFVCVKSHQLPGVAHAIDAACGPDTALVFPQNGLPWWYFQHLGGPHDGARLACLDPDGVLQRSIDPARIVGGVIYKSVQVTAPAAIRVVDLPEDRLVLGEIRGAVSARVERIAQRIASGGLRAVPTADIRREKWRKLVTNVAWNPVCTLTNSTIAAVCRDAGTRQLCGAIMQEALRVASRLGADPDLDPERLLEAGSSKTDHVPSMLQDLRAGRPLEHAAIVGATIEASGLVGEPTPVLAAIGALIARLDPSGSSPPPT